LAWKTKKRRRKDKLPFPRLPEGTDTLPQVDHVLVLMMENHSYDNYLGMLGRGRRQQPRGDGFTLGPDETQPNRRYLLAATSVGMVDDVLPENLVPAPEGTIFDRLDAHRIPWRNYYSSFPPTSYLFLGDAVRDHASVVPVAQFFADAKSGNLPEFAIIDPDFGHSSGENPQNIVHAEVFAASVVQAVMQSPAWPRTLLVWTFDEGGGYYDHVPPPTAAAPDDIPPLPPAPRYDGFARYGFRVPAVVVSPWSRPGHVTSVTHDHTSILAMVERKWNLPAMTSRDAAADDLTDFLDLDSPAFAEPPALARPRAGRAQTRCEKSGPGQIPPPGSVTR
jgi:phospholipase C